MRAFLLALILVAGALAAAAGAEPIAERATVASVSDGDTIRLSSGTRVRLVQIDAPEVGECHWRASRATLLELTPPGSRVALERDLRLDDADRFGRLLRYVTRDAMNVNVELVRRGAAAPYFFGGERGTLARRLLAAARAARAARRGLWRSCPATPLDPYGQVDTGPDRIRPIAPPVSSAPDGPAAVRYAGPSGKL